MLILKVILQVLAVGLVLLTSTLDYVAYDKGTRWFKRLRVWLYCVAVLFLVASLAATIGDDIARREEIAALRLESNRNLHRIADVGLEFVVFLPMDIPALANYSKRISSIIHSIHSSLPSQDAATLGPMTVPFTSKGPSLPDLETERMAYTFLSHVCIGLEIFVDSAKAQTFIPEAGHSQQAGDLVFSLSRSAGPTEKNDVSLGIDIRENRFSLIGWNAKTGPSQKSTGKIVSIPDLAAATAVMYFCQRGYQDEAEKREFLSVTSELQMVIFGLNFSGGQRMYFRLEKQMNKYGEQVYIFKFPETAKEVQDLIQQ